MNYYALSDAVTGDNPTEPTSGFANTKYVIAFPSKKQRDEWVANTNLLTARPITRKEAIKFTKWETGDFYGCHCEKVKPVRLHNSFDFVILKRTEN